MALVACMSLLAPALSAVPARAAADPAAVRSTDLIVRQLAPDDWNCQDGYSCYFDGLNGQGKLFTAGRCGWHDLRKGPYQDKISSIANYGSGKVEVYKYWPAPADYWELKGWVTIGEEGNFPDNAVSIDAISIWCHRP